LLFGHVVHTESHSDEHFYTVYTHDDITVYLYCDMAEDTITITQYVRTTMGVDIHKKVVGAWTK